MCFSATRLLPHATAFCSAATAGFGTLLAMRHGVLRALLAARFADVRAQCANVACTFTVARHRARGRSANLGAVNVEGNAARHRFHVGLLQARRGAVVARRRTLIACFDASGKLFMSHLVLQKTEPDSRQGMRAMRTPTPNGRLAKGSSTVGADACIDRDILELSGPQEYKALCRPGH